MNSISIDGLRELMKAQDNFVIIFAMFGCNPCEDLRNLVGNSTHIKTDLDNIPLYYLKLRPSAFRSLREQDVLKVVPTISCFIEGKRTADFEGHNPLLTYVEFEETLQNEFINGM